MVTSAQHRPTYAALNSTDRGVAPTLPVKPRCKLITSVVVCFANDGASPSDRIIFVYGGRFGR